MYISLSFAVIQCNGNNNKFTHHHHSLICVRPHYFLTSHFVTRVPCCCCCCCEWCDVAVDLQTDKTQSSDTWWARSAARECCLRPGPGGNTLTLTRVWSVCVHTQNAFEIKYFLQNCTSAISLRCLGFIFLFLLYFWLRCVYQAQCGPPGQWGWGDHMGHAPVWAGDQGVSHGAGLSVTQTGLVSVSASGATMWCHVTGITMSWSEHLQGQSIGISSCSQNQPYYKCFLPRDSFVRLLAAELYSDLVCHLNCQSFYLNLVLQVPASAEILPIRDNPVVSQPHDPKYPSLAKFHQ